MASQHSINPLLNCYAGWLIRCSLGSKKTEGGHAAARATALAGMDAAPVEGWPNMFSIGRR